MNKWRMIKIRKMGYYLIFNEDLPFNSSHRRDTKEEASELKNKLNKKIRMEQ